MIKSKPSKNLIENCPAGFKLSALCLFSIIVFFVTNPFYMFGILIGILCLFFLAKFSFIDILKTLKPMWWIILIIAVFQFFISPPETTFIILMRLIAFILAASLVTMTTPSAQMLETFEWFFKPLKYVGIKPAKVSLALSLTLRLIPLFHIILQDVQEAQKTRGLEKNIFALIIPISIRILKMSDDISNAIEARCYDPD